MVFLQVPGDFAPLYGALTFQFGDAALPRDLKVAVVDELQGETLFTKSFYSTNQAEIDPAPLLRRRQHWSPGEVVWGVSKAESRMPHLLLQVEDAEARCTVAPVQPGVEIQTLNTTMPDLRILAWGESEELFLGPGVARVLVQVYAPDNSFQINYRARYSTECQLFRLKSSEFPTTTQRIEVMLLDSEQNTLRTIRYLVVRHPEPQMRLAWMSSRGSVEHYTFPCIEEQQMVQHSEPIRMANGEMKRLANSREQLWRVSSAYERPEVLEALMEIASSPQVWCVEGESDYREVGVRCEEQAIDHHGLIGKITLQVSPTWKQLVLWS